MQENSIVKAVNMMILTNRMHKKLIDSSVCAKIGLHRTQHITLMHLARREKLPSQKELAEHLNITPAAVTATLKKLEQGGYIERTAGCDNRYNEITITTLGKSVVEETKMMFTNIDTALFDNFTNEEISHFVSCFEKIQCNINKKMKNSIAKQLSSLI